jgi:hypothetical protein
MSEYDDDDEFYALYIKNTPKDLNDLCDMSEKKSK